VTFSILGHCSRTGAFGIAISSSSPAVAARCAHARAGVGVVASQNITDPRLGPWALDLMAAGDQAEAAVGRLRESAPNMWYRQLALVGREGGSAVYSGEGVLGCHNAATASGAAAAGNLLANQAVPVRMLERFLARAGGDLGDRLIAALQEGQRAGGEAGPVRSAGLLLVRDVSWPVADLRVDWYECDPIGALARLWMIYKPQLEDYVTRALDPKRAPRFGVQGDV
jgi:uncharacterized Ntn-hydrolase superfamily protein